MSMRERVCSLSCGDAFHGTAQFIQRAFILCIAVFVLVRLQIRAHRFANLDKLYTTNWRNTN